MKHRVFIALILIFVIVGFIFYSLNEAPGKEDPPLSLDAPKKVSTDYPDFAADPVPVEEYAALDFVAAEHVTEPELDQPYSTKGAEDFYYCVLTFPMYRLREELQPWLSQLTPETLPYALDFLSNLPDKSAQEYIWVLFLEAWAAFDGPGALEKARSLAFDFPIEGGAVRGWYSAEPEVVISWINGPFSDKVELEHGLYGFAMALVHHHAPQEAFDHLRSIDDVERRQTAAIILIEALGESDIVSYFDLAALIEDAANEGWVAGAGEVVTKSLLESDAALTDAWIDSLPSSPVRKAALGAALEETAITKGSDIAAEWLNRRLGDGDLDQAIAKYARLYAYLEPDVMLLWAQEIQDSELRLSTLDYVSTMASYSNK